MMEPWSHLKSELETPALLISASRVRRNVNRMADYARANGLHLRPHTKTHKLRSLALLQLEAGAIGITTAKVSEAEILSELGQDVLVAYPPVGQPRARRLASLARDRTVRAAVDSLDAVETISAAARHVDTVVGLLVELDVGMGRTGAETPAATLPLAQAIDRTANVRLDGLMFYPGHVWESSEQQRDSMARVDALIEHALDLWRQHGLQSPIVSGGSTPTAYQSHLLQHTTEIRPGTYIFNDMNTVRGGFCALDDCAACVVATVISDSINGQIVLDAGSKTLTSDRCIPGSHSGHGYLVEYPQARIHRLSEEHGQVDIRECCTKPCIGERVTIIPNHICPCINLQQSVWWAESDGKLTSLTVDARGRIQ